MDDQHHPVVFLNTEIGVWKPDDGISLKRVQNGGWVIFDLPPGEHLSARIIGAYSTLDEALTAIGGRAVDEEAA